MNPFKTLSYKMSKLCKKEVNIYSAKNLNRNNNVRCIFKHFIAFDLKEIMT